MSRANDKHHGDDVEKPAGNPAAEVPGKVVIDSRGHNVWQWAKDVIESTSVLLKRLENKDLSLEPTRKVPILPDRQAAEKSVNAKAAKPDDSKATTAKRSDSKAPARHPELQPDQRRDKGGGFDPYNRR